MPRASLEVKDPRWKVFVYGKAGTGKTTMASKITGRKYLLSLDKSFERIPYFHTEHRDEVWQLESPVMSDLADFVRYFDEIADQFDVLIVDNVTSLQKLWFVDQAKESKNTLDNKISHYGEFTNYFIRFMYKLFSYDLNVFITAHEEPRKTILTSGQEASQIAPELRDAAANWLMGMCDIVGRMTVKPGTGERGVILQGTDDVLAKNRLDGRKGCKVEDLFNFADPNV